MKELAFKKSNECSVGIEIELQIINSYNFDLISRSKEILQNIKEEDYPGRIKPELIQSIIELNTTIHERTDSLLQELESIKSVFIAQAKAVGVRFAGGGIHPFEKWQERKIYPAERYKKISEIYGYLAQQDSVFGQHIHIGCKSGNEAVYLTHILSLYLPHFIALSASSPFYQGVDTKFDSARVNISNAFPTSGYIYFVKNWKDFCNYFEKMRNFKVVDTMKDFYWDIRPKPEFGTVEIRICDSPLTLERAVLLAAYVQTLAHYILHEKPYRIQKDIYMFYQYNRFQAARFGYEGQTINIYENKLIGIGEDILRTLETINPHAILLGNERYLSEIAGMVENQENDAKWQRETFTKLGSLEKLVYEQSKLWMGD